MRWPFQVSEDSAASALLSKPMRAVSVTALLVGVAYVVPGADRFRLLSPKELDPVPVAAAASDRASASTAEVKLVEETKDQPELAIPDQVDPSRAASDAEIKAPPEPIVDPSGHALDAFYEALVQVDRKTPGAVARILHYGDSLLAIDYVSGTLRRQLQQRFGDAGHGYMPIANPWPGYFHNDVMRLASNEWTVSRVVGPFASDNLYGLGGVSFVGHNRAAWSRFATAERGHFGLAMSRFGLQFLKQPGGGVIEVSIDKGPAELVQTEGEEPKFAEFSKAVGDGPHSVEIRVQKGPVRAFGAWFERDAPGVVLDSVGIQGCRLRFLDQSDDKHWAEALQVRRPNLVILEFGLNESSDDYAYPMDRYKETSLAVVKQLRAALPKSSCLVVAPNDVAIKRGTELTSRRVMNDLVRVQKEVAAESGCAFFDTFKAMGGSGSMGRWVSKGLGGPDFTHPTIMGADLIGSWIYQGLMLGYRTYREGNKPSSAPSAAAPAVGSSGASVPAR